jgi:tetratricopeptide (TPR) repeat protein
MSAHRAAVAWTAVRIVMMAMLASLAVPVQAQAQPPAISESDAHAYEDLLTVYRGGEIERAVEGLARLLAASGGQRQITRWIGEMQDANRRSELEAALLLYSDAIMILWSHDDPYPTRKLEPYMAPFERLHLTLKRMDPKSPFLRAWYLLWESFRHVHVNQLVPVELDYLDEALAAFPVDAQILLAAGSRQELYWWMSLENAQRDPGREPPSITRFLTGARDYLRRSVTADPNEPEARLRLVHVLLELNDFADVSRLLAEHDWTADGAAFEYLARLFEGDLHERQGDRTAAAAAYDRAIALVAAPQSARIARAHLAHLDGRRSEAVATVAPALSDRSDQADPWWPYIRGQAWRFEGYLRIAHSMVIK